MLSKSLSKLEMRAYAEMAWGKGAVDVENLLAVIERANARSRVATQPGENMTHHFHAVVSIDHAEAVIFEFAKDDVSEQHFKATDRQGNIHHKAGSVGSGHTHDSKTYLAAIVAALKPSHEILIVGHGTAKDELASFIRDQVPLLAPRILGVEAMDKPSKGQILAFARKFFESKDLTTPQI
jgi:stalled ribosome rescue protein Dom34